jgi:cytochrome c peroxidase
MKTLLWVLLTACALAPCGGASAQDALPSLAALLFGRVEAPAGAETAEQKLGRALFWDERLSLDGKTACASCHAAADWGADRRQFSRDARGVLTSRHSPTIFNAMTQTTVRWLNDRKSGADQAEGSLVGSMGFASKADGVKKMHELGYERLFRAAYPAEAEPVTPANYGRALAAYQATLLTPAAFDRFLAGAENALTPQQKRGLSTFINAGCAGCHNGALLGGKSMHRFGVVKDYWLETASVKVDPGLFAISKREEDRYVFRVPMLRNVAKTAPYFHDGSVATLEQAVRVMASVQLGRSLDDGQVGDIAAFLQSLTGDVPANYAAPASFPR